MFNALMSRPVSALPHMGTLWEMFEDELSGVLSPWYDRSSALRPSVDVVENDKTYDLAVDMPGFDKKDIKVDVKDGVLSISGTRKIERKKEDKRYAYYERSAGEFQRNFRLPDTVDPESVKATYKDGVLHLVLDKREEVKPKTIEIT